MSANDAALIAVCVLGAIVAWDAYWLTRQRQDIPNLGELPNGGFAWTSEGPQEVIRQWGNLASMAAMNPPTKGANMGIQEGANSLFGVLASLS